MTFTSLRLPDDIDSRLNTLALRTGRSKSFYILEALREHLGGLEAAYEADLDMRQENNGRETVQSPEKALEPQGAGSQEDMRDKNIFYLGQQEWDKFMQALDAPALPDKALAALLAQAAPWEN